MASQCETSFGLGRGVTVDPIIVCGSGRSGTSITTRVLGLHEAIWAFRWESQLLSGLPGLADLVNAPGFSTTADRNLNARLGKTLPGQLLLSYVDNKRIEKFRIRVLSHLFRRSVRGSYDAGLFEIVEYEPLEQALGELKMALRSARSYEDRLSACRTFCDRIFAQPAAAAGASFWCEKTPRNLLYADIIGQILPSAKFIHMIRDGRDVVSSIMANRFWPVAKSARYPETRIFKGVPKFAKLAQYWTKMMDIAAVHQEALGPQRWLNVRLEDLIAHPKECCDRILGFLNIENSGQFTTEVSRIIEKSRAHQHRWRADLSPEQQRQFLVQSKENLERFGYV